MAKHQPKADRNFSEVISEYGYLIRHGDGLGSRARYAPPTRRNSKVGISETRGAIKCIRYNHHVRINLDCVA